MPKSNNIWIHLRQAPWVGLVILLLLLIAALFAEIVSPHSPVDQDITQALSPPLFFEGGNWNHLLGTDELGRDILSRIIFGARISLVVGFIAVAISGFIGTCLGLVSGYFGGRTDSIIMRIVDIQLSMPYILIALALIGALGPSLRNIIIVIGITSWVDYARIVRGEVLSIKENEFVDLAKIAGCRTSRSSPRYNISPFTIRPAGLGTNRNIEREVTLFPLPDSPTIPRAWPFLRWKLPPSTALTTPALVKKCVLRFLTSNIFSFPLIISCL